jgi:hypothetical protein
MGADGGKICHFQVRENTAASGDITFARFTEIGGTGRPVQKLYSDVPLQEGDGRRQRRWRPSEPNGSLCKAAFVDDGDECLNSFYPVQLFHSTQESLSSFGYSSALCIPLNKDEIQG